MKAKPVIAVVGGMIMDLVFETDRVPERGESLDANSLACKPGGKGANTAVAIYRAQRSHPLPMSARKQLIKFDADKPDHAVSTISSEKSGTKQEGEVRVCLNSAVGDDVFGIQLRDSLRRNGLDDAGVRTVPGQPTSTCVVFVETNKLGSRDIGYPGANSHWQPPAQSTLATLESLAGQRKPDLLVCNFEVKLVITLKMLELATEQNVETVLNPSPPPVHGCDDSIYQHVTHLVLNTVEASKLIQKDPESLGEDKFWASPWGLQDVQYWRLAANFFLEKGVQNVVMTVGDKGAFYACKEARGFVEAELDVEVKDTTGAGDTFLGVYALEVFRQRSRGEWDIMKAVRRGCKAAARTVTELGAQESIPWADEIDSENKDQRTKTTQRGEKFL